MAPKAKPFNPTKKYNPTVATRVTHEVREKIEESVKYCGVTMTMWLQAAIEDKLEKEKPQ